MMKEMGEEEGKMDEEILMQILDLARELQGDKIIGKKKPVGMKVEIESVGAGEVPAALKEAMMGEKEDEEVSDVSDIAEKMAEEEMEDEISLKKKGKIY